jgi:hypothetical protein
MWGKTKSIFYRWLAKNRLVRRYEYLNEVTKILEEYVTQRILDGGSPDFLNKSRQTLVQHQGEIKENQRLIEFIKKLK